VSHLPAQTRSPPLTSLLSNSIGVTHHNSRFVFDDDRVLCSLPFDDNHVIVDFDFVPIHVSFLGWKEVNSYFVSCFLCVAKGCAFDVEFPFNSLSFNIFKIDESSGRKTGKFGVDGVSSNEMVLADPVVKKTYARCNN